MAIFGVLLVKSVIKEVKRRSELKRLSLELKELTDHLQEEVDEQTKDIKKAYETEKESKRKLTELNLTKDRFIVEAQRYLKPPLSNIRNNINNILGASSGVEEVLRLALEKISSSAARLDSLVGEFMGIVGRELATGSNLNKEVVNVKDLLSEILEEFKEQIESKSIRLEVVFLPRYEDNFLSVDREKLKKALANVIDNAVKYNKSYGSIVIKVEKVKYPIERDKQLLRIAIEDTGIGISKEEMKKLFISYFERGEEAQKLYTTGRGIGLAVAKNIINAHNGRLFAESGGKEQGSKFFIEIPVE